MNAWDGSIPCHPYDAARVVYIEVPKAGCTSIKSALSVLKGGPPEPGEDVHHWTSYTMARDHGELARWLDTRWRDYFRFTVVRHPLRRFESFFYGLAGLDRVAAGTDVNRYVANHFETDPRRLDIHAVPQTLILGTELWRYDFVGRVEDMAAVGTRLSEVTGRELAVPHHNASPATYRRELARHTVAHLAAIYRDDLDVLGYDVEGMGVGLVGLIGAVA